MRKVHKFKLSGIGIIGIQMPKDAVIMSAQLQVDDVQIWALCECDSETETREFYLVGTGWEIPNDRLDLKFIATIMQESGFVWHVFEIIKT